MPDRILPLAGLVLALGALPSRAQTPVDSAAARTAALPVADRAMDMAGLLARVPGSFVYDFGASGWPDGWSPYGLDPRRVAVRVEHVPFDDPVSGAPVWEFVPLAQIAPPDQVALDRGRTDVVDAPLRTFEIERPLTEIRYRSSADGLQAVDVNHVQRRAAGDSVRATILFGYGGAGARNEYEGSRLRRKRRIVGRIRLERGSWSFALTELYNRQRLGAHGGVLPVPGYEYESVYNRLLAGVDEPSARRIRLRNDLVLSATGPVGGRPFDARAYWTTGTLQYTAPDDTTTARTSRLGLSGVWTLPDRTLPLELSVAAQTDAVRSGDAFRGREERTATADFRVSASPALGAWPVRVGLGITSFDGAVRPGAHAGTDRTVGPVRIHGSATLAHQPPSMVERWGFGGTFVSDISGDPSRTLRLRAGLELERGVFRVAAEAFVRSTDGAILLLLDAASDTVHVATAPGTLEARGITLSSGLRETASSGWYATGSATWQATPPASDPALERAQAAQPEFHGTIRTGLRARMFGGDLDLDLAVQGRFWTATPGLRLHAPTGLLAIPDESAREVPGSAIVDVTVDAGVRSATVFLAVENVLSGTTLVVGNQLVPDYPYPERRFRFGVYWPIPD